MLWKIALQRGFSTPACLKMKHRVTAPTASMTSVNQIAMAAATTSNPAKSPRRFSTDQAGYAAMRTYAKAWPDRLWAHAVVTVR